MLLQRAAPRHYRASADGRQITLGRTEAAVYIAPMQQRLTRTEIVDRERHEQVRIHTPAGWITLTVEFTSNVRAVLRAETPLDCTIAKRDRRTRIAPRDDSLDEPA